MLLKVIFAVAIIGFLVFESVNLIRSLKDRFSRKKKNTDVPVEEDKNLDKEDKS